MMNKSSKRRRVHKRSSRLLSPRRRSPRNLMRSQAARMSLRPRRAKDLRMMMKMRRMRMRRTRLRRRAANVAAMMSHQTKNLGHLRKSQQSPRRVRQSNKPMSGSTMIWRRLSQRSSLPVG
jgi:hypothetical protein